MPSGIIAVVLGIFNLLLIWFIYVKLEHKIQKEYSSMWKGVASEVESRVRFEFVGVYKRLYDDIDLLFDYLNLEIEKIEPVEATRMLVPKKERVVIRGIPGISANSPVQSEEDYKI